MKAVVSLNSGSSSIKFALFTIDAQGAPRFSAGGKIEGIGVAPHLVGRATGGEVLVERSWKDGASLGHDALLADLFEWSAGHLGDNEVIAIGHRVVHGGTEFASPRLVDDALLEKLEALCPLAPLHQPHNLAAIRAIAKLQPRLPQVACFDTAFHHDMPEIAARLAIPRALHDRGIRRYGFHGLSYEYIARSLAELDPPLAGGRVIAAHLGNGASLCAIRGGKSVDTTMGFTALDGLMMGTRCGSIDPGVALHLETQIGMSPAQVEDLFYNKSGLLGVSGVSSDMRALHGSSDPRAAEAVELFAWRAAREAGALIASLEGLDGLVFTAGIGENDPVVRASICERLAWAGIVLDPESNARNTPVISAGNSRIAVRVIPTDEERMIAIHMLNVLNSGSLLDGKARS
ncbi:acetate/propionate family kinase [Sphingomonas histidinilytica]|uniref:acetate/propionate family kinase n=1 Tax=Rhizorhabdus histidinilytica TaxID=439228 RepID=UPI001ADBE96D|nr:acetate/propionate family kinase [Rhizorhabdus histidinilytica]MBO9378734.1 acetate/propionate family kinase [Rhizorhabdus histidinilytica]